MLNLNNTLLKNIFANSFILSIFLLIVSCNNATENQLIIISPHNPEIRHEFSIGFSKWYYQKHSKPIAIKWLDVGGTGEAIKYIRSRNSGKKQNGGVDVFFGGGDYPFIKLKSQQLLLPYLIDSASIAKIPKSVCGIPVYPGDSSWYGAALSGFGIVYNKKILLNHNLPQLLHWQDLALPEFQGWVACADPRYSGSVHTMFELMLQTYGWEKGWDIICRMGANVENFTNSAAIVAKDVALGQAACGMAIDFYALIEIERLGSQRLGFSLPENETVITPDGIGIINNAPNPQAAKEFVEYVMSEGQLLWILKKGVVDGPRDYSLCRFPVDSTLYSIDSSKVTITQNPFNLHSALKYDAGLAGKRWAILGDLIAATIIVPHGYLKKTWKAVNKGADLSKPLFNINISEQEIMDLANNWGDPDYATMRIMTMNKWSFSAVKHYKDVAKEQ